MLLQADAYVDAKNQENYTPLMFAAEAGHKEIVQYLLDAHANIDLKNMQDANALDLAVENGHKDIVPMLGTLLNAVKIGNTDTVQRRLAGGSDVNAIDEFGKTPILWAAEKGTKDIIRLLVAAKADVNQKTNGDGCTALMLAAEAGHKDVILILLNANADINAVNNESKSALVLAFESKNKEIVQLLVEKCVVLLFFLFFILTMK